MAGGGQDPYRYVDLRTATRAGGAMFLAGLAFAAVALPLSPPSGPLGHQGVAAFMALALALGVRQLRRRNPAGPTVNLAGVHLALVAIVVYRAGEGPGAPFEQLLFMTAIYACAVHPVPRALVVLFCATAVSLTPTWYEAVDRQFVAATVSHAMLVWIVGGVVLAWMTRVRRARAEGEQAVQLARADALTGLGNRRALEEALPQAVAAARRHDEPLSLLVGDLRTPTSTRRRTSRAGSSRPSRCRAGRRAGGRCGSPSAPLSWAPARPGWTPSHGPTPSCSSARRAGARRPRPAGRSARPRRPRSRPW